MEDEEKTNNYTCILKIFSDQQESREVTTQISYDVQWLLLQVQ